MRYKRAFIDSLNLSDEHLEATFIHNENYRIQIVKSKVVFQPKVWSETFGKPLKQNIIEAKIIHTYLGQTIPLKTFAPTPLSQTVEFAGLHGYNERSRLLTQALRELKSQLEHTRITRIDISIDYKGEIPKSIVKILSRTRKPFKWYNTIYWKTEKEKKTNRVMDIKIYNKSLKEKLDYPLMRLEFVFKSEYLKKILLADLKEGIKKMEKTIKRATGLNVKIDNLFTSATRA